MGKKPLFISRENSGYFDDVLKPIDIQPYFQNQHISSGYIRVVKSGEVCQKETWTFVAQNSTDNFSERLTDVRKLFDLFNEGATIIIEWCETVFPSLNDLRLALENELKSMVQANIYITPQNSFCFEPHLILIMFLSFRFTVLKNGIYTILRSSFRLKRLRWNL